jgi:hypothetical protein
LRSISNSGSKISENLTSGSISQQVSSDNLPGVILSIQKELGNIKKSIDL